MRRKFIVFYLMFFAFLLVGCISLDKPDDLTENPLVFLEDEEYKVIVNGFLSKNDSLTMPLTGEQKSFFAVDLDSNGKEELVVLFRNEENFYGFFILKEVQGYWKKIFSNHISYSNAINFIDFIDFNNDGKKEIIIAWDNDSYLQPLRIFSLRGEEFNKVLASFYGDLLIDDIDMDGQEELIILEGSFYPYSDYKLNVLKYRETGFENVFTRENKEKVRIKSLSLEKGKEKKEIIVDYYDKNNKLQRDSFLFQ